MLTLSKAEGTMSDFDRNTKIEELSRELRLIAWAAQGACDCGSEYEGAGGIIAEAVFKAEQKLKALQ
jgi:hypothetical protein